MVAIKIRTHLWSLLKFGIFVINFYIWISIAMKLRHYSEGKSDTKLTLINQELSQTSLLQISNQKPLSLDNPKVNPHNSYIFMYGTTAVKVLGSVPSNELTDTVWLFIGIHSRPEMGHRRQTLRQTYLSQLRQNVNKTNNNKVIHRFILGWPTRDLIIENSKYKDMIFVNQSERYTPHDSILPYKHAAILNTAKRLKAKWLLKTVDDAMINLPAVLDKLKYLLPYDFYGHCLYESYPIRDKRNVWYISEYFWPGLEPYPPFCIGAGYLLPYKSYTCASDIISHPTYRFFPLDDVETGVLMRRCNMTCVNVKGIYGEVEPGTTYFLVQQHLRSALSLRMYWNMAVKMNKLGITSPP